jgi:hypothetical protein
VVAIKIEERKKESQNPLGDFLLMTKNIKRYLFDIKIRPLKGKEEDNKKVYICSGPIIVL